MRRRLVPCSAATRTRSSHRHCPARRRRRRLNHGAPPRRRRSAAWRLHRRRPGVTAALRRDHAGGAWRRGGRRAAATTPCRQRAPFSIEPSVLVGSKLYEITKWRVSNLSLMSIVSWLSPSACTYSTLEPFIAVQIHALPISRQVRSYRG